MQYFSCQRERHRKETTMREYMFEYDTIEGFCGTAYVWAKNHSDAKRQIKEELKLYGGGHADVYTDGTLRFDVEV